MPFSLNFESVFGIIVIISLLQIPLSLFFRQQARLNPARHTAFNEPVLLQAHITVRSRLPTRLWRPNHWHFANSNVVDIFVRTSTVQVSSSILRRRGRRYGWFLTSSQTTMWLSSMRPFPMSRNQQQCIVLSGSFPFRGQDRGVELAIFSREQTQHIWEALTTSGVRGAASPDGQETPVLALQAVASSPTWGTTITAPGRAVAPPPAFPPSPPFPSSPTIPRSFSPQSYAPPGFVPQSYAPQGTPPYTPQFAPPAKRRKWPFVAVGLFVCSPLLLGVILSHVLGHQSDLVVVVTGPATVATVSNVACDAPSANGEIHLSGTITAVADAPNGLTLHGSIESPTGAPIGPGGFAPLARLDPGQSEVFQSFFPDYDADSPDRCVVTWSATGG